MKTPINTFLLIVLLIHLSCKKEELNPTTDNQTTSNVDLTQPDEPENLEIISNRPCENGLAGIFPCSGFDLISFIPLDLFDAIAGNDSWGWTDPETQKEYALFGVENGTVFIDISQPDAPIVLGKLPTATESSWWRDIKVYKNHAFIVSEARGHGLQVFDLTQLRNATPNQEFSADARLTTFGSAHNIAISETNGFAYVVGSESYNGGPIFIDINDPKSPQEVGGYEADSYTHDAQTVIYQGPDSDYSGREILVASNSVGGENNQVVILDVTNKEEIIKISSFTYSDGGYTHQGWFTEDQHYFILGDELDEIQKGFKTNTRIIDLTDLDEPKLHMNFFGPTSAVDHNGYVNGSIFYMANYTYGMRALNISKIQEKNITEIGFFDTYPEDNSIATFGAWNVYPYFQSENILISDINLGMFLVKASE
tara:strand:+ start:787 stop:2061 length:1275 start_codon:yes stop_codon:yes gene_type:complete